MPNFDKISLPVSSKSSFYPFPSEKTTAFVFNRISLCGFFVKPTLPPFCVHIYRFFKLIFELRLADFYFGVDFDCLKVYYLIADRLLPRQEENYVIYQ